MSLFSAYPDEIRWRMERREVWKWVQKWKSEAIPGQVMSLRRGKCTLNKNDNDFLPLKSPIEKIMRLEMEEVQTGRSTVNEAMTIPSYAAGGAPVFIPSVQTELSNAQEASSPRALENEDEGHIKMPVTTESSPSKFGEREEEGKRHSANTQVQVYKHGAIEQPFTRSSSVPARHTFFEGRTSIVNEALEPEVQERRKEVDTAPCSVGNALHSPEHTTSTKANSNMIDEMLSTGYKAISNQGKKNISIEVISSASNLADNPYFFAESPLKRRKLVDDSLGHVSTAPQMANPHQKQSESMLDTNMFAQSPLARRRQPSQILTG